MSVGTSASFLDSTVLVAGATGAIGSRVVERLLTDGAKVGIAVRKAWQVGKLVERHGDAKVLVGHVDATDGEAAAGFVKGVEDSLGPIRALIVAAGAFAFAPVGRDKADERESLMAANYLAATTLARAVVSPMKRRRTGSLVFVGAAAAESAVAGMAAYLASKAALHAYARCLAAELAVDGLRVTVVAPGTIDTAANRAAMPTASRDGWVSEDRVVDALLAAAAARDVTTDPIQVLQA